MAITLVDKPKVVKSGTLMDQEFKILATPHAFRALSNGIYESKISSILRELGTNSYDSHVEAGKKDIPFTIHLPSVFECYYECRDRGVGLSQSDVVNLYSVYFKSGVNRCKSNDFVSVFGVGSKSPFAYSSSFLVSSFQNGTKSTYSCFINEEGLPKVSLLGTSKTTEEDGLSVKFSVKSHDVYAFRDAAQRIFSYFKTIPTVTGYTTSITPIQYSLKTNDYGIRLNDCYGELRAVMGNIAYPVSKTGLPDVKNQKVFTSGIDLFFNIGDIEPAISRETLSYNKATVKAVTNKINDILNSISNEIEKSIQSCSSIYEARKTIYTKVVKTNLSNLIDYKSLKYNGQIIGDRDIQFDNSGICEKDFYPGSL